MRTGMYAALTEPMLRLQGLKWFGKRHTNSSRARERYVFAQVSSHFRWHYRAKNLPRPPRLIMHHITSLYSAPGCENWLFPAFWLLIFAQRV
jgi:hypothetical protein